MSAAVVLVLAGCSAGGHSVGDGVVTKLHDGAFDGTVRLTTTKVERVTNAAMQQFGLTTKGDDGYFATATVQVTKGDFPAASAKDFGNAAWGLVANGSLQGGPSLAAKDRTSLLQKSCPFDADRVATALQNGRKATVCAVLLAPKGSSVTAVTYLQAKSTDSSVTGPSTITWTNKN
jgi:hypothetical protein